MNTRDYAPEENIAYWRKKKESNLKIVRLRAENKKLKEQKKELIDFVKEQIKLCKKAQQLALQNKMIEQVGNFNLRIATYNEILSKIEKEKI